MDSDDFEMARKLIARYHRAMIEKDADAFAALYAENAVHEFPLLSPFFPQRLEGREQIRRHYKTVWGASPMRIVAIRDVAIHHTNEAGVTVAEAEYEAESTITHKRFELSFIIVMRTKEGLIVHLRDYMDALGAAFELDALPRVVDTLRRRREGATQ
jgi:ketosteroid isomerase-like protein